ncbi:hypothetical protein [Photobacterium phage PDCC-1]|uniref:Uncharacterized protein n=1 Tax=Photobacterium phage PDCC-1 TaxID=2664246 RepID=A0A6B9J4G4_9CAUD|nr:hypothetical protein HWC77_gp119 [Photobacterium phage PDCC-1]QGZ14482.1 hypothetical protein [Photobacterium phage PDCC-1]
MHKETIFKGRRFSLSTQTTSTIESEMSGNYGVLVISLDNGQETTTIRRTYPKSFIDGFYGSEEWGPQNLTQILLGLFLIEPNGVITLSRTPRTCLSILINVYREEFCIQGCYFYTKLDFSMDYVRISSQIEEDVMIETPNIRELTTTMLTVIMEASERYSKKR